jgi:Tfp pilus assembly protein PilN
MRPLNLIPPEERRGEAAPLRAGILSYAILGALALVLLGVVGLVLAGNSIKEQEAKLAALEVRKESAELRAAELSPYGEVASLAASRTETVDSLAESRFDWERVMRELALVIPENVWLESLTGTVSPGVTIDAEGAGETTVDPSVVGPSLQISGCAASQNAVASFLASLKDIDGVTRVGMQQSKLGDLDNAELGTTGGPPTGGAAAQGEDDCQTRTFIAAFDITVAFDEVPTSPYTPGSTAAPAPTAPATAGTDDGGTAEAGAESEAAEDSAAEQSETAQESAETVGVG